MRNLQRVAPLESKVASRRVFLSFLPTLAPPPWRIDAGHTLNTKDGKKTIVGIGLIEGCVGLAVLLGAMGGVLSANAMPEGLSED